MVKKQACSVGNKVFERLTTSFNMDTELSVLIFRKPKKLIVNIH